MIEMYVKAGQAHKQRDDAVVIPLLGGRKLSESGKLLQQETGKALPSFLRKQDVSGKFGESKTLYHVEGSLSSRIVLLGCGDEKLLTLHKLRMLSARVARELDAGGARDAVLYLSELSVRGASLADKVQAVAEGVWLGLYRFDKYQSSKEGQERRLRSVTVMITSRRDLDTAQAALDCARAVSAGTNLPVTWAMSRAMSVRRNFLVSRLPLYRMIN